MLARILCIFGIHAAPIEKVYTFQSYWFCSRCGKLIERKKKKNEGFFG